MAFILNSIVGSSVGCPLNCPLFPYLKVVGYLLSCPMSCPLYPYMAVVGSLICMAKFPWAAHRQPTPLPTELPTFYMFGSSGLPTELTNVSIYGSSGQPNLHGKIPKGSPWAANSAVHWAANFFFILEVVGCLLSCPLSCPLFPYIEVVGSLIFIAKFSWAAHGQPTPLPTCSPWAAKWAAPLFFPYGYPYLKVVGYPLSCPLSCPLYPYIAVVGSLICIAKFPWAAHGQPTPLPTELPTFHIWK